MTKKSIKDLSRSIFLALLVPLLGWATWVTAQTYNTQQTKQEFVEHKVYAAQQQRELKQELNEFQKEVRENHQIVYKILLDLQKQMGDINNKK
jgi:hypothetical protein